MAFFEAMPIAFRIEIPDSSMVPSDRETIASVLGGTRDAKIMTVSFGGGSVINFRRPAARESAVDAPLTERDCELRSHLADDGDGQDR